MSTVAEVAALATYFSRQLKPEPRISLSRPDRPGTGQMSWLVDRASLIDVLPAIAPGLEQTISIMGTSVTRRVAMEHPDFTGLRAIGYDVAYRYGHLVDFGTAGAADENLALVTVNFESLPYSPSGDDAYLNVDVQQYDRDFPVDAATFAGGGTPAYETGIDSSGLRYAVTVFDAPGVDASVEAFWWSQCNKVNSDTFRGIPAGYVMFKGPRLSYRYQNDGTRVCTYTLSFDAGPILWNYGYNRSGVLEQINVNGAVRYGSVAIGSLWR